MNQTRSLGAALYWRIETESSNRHVLSAAGDGPSGFPSVSVAIRAEMVKLAAGGRMAPSPRSANLASSRSWVYRKNICPNEL